MSFIFTEKYRKSSIKPPGAHLIFKVLEGGLLERRTYLKIRDQGYKKLARGVECLYDYLLLWYISFKTS